MDAQAKNISLYDMYNVLISEDQMALRVDRDGPWDYHDLFTLLRERAASGVRKVLVDKRQHITSFDKVSSGCGHPELGPYIFRNGIRFAAVLNEDDHVEKIACYHVMRYGGAILSTHSLDEARLWLASSVN